MKPIHILLLLLTACAKEPTHPRILHIVATGNAYYVDDKYIDSGHSYTQHLSQTESGAVYVASSGHNCIVPPPIAVVVSINNKVILKDTSTIILVKYH